MFHFSIPVFLNFSITHGPWSLSKMQHHIAAAQTVIAAFHQIFAADRSSDEELGRTIPLPSFSPDIVRSVCYAALIHFMKVPTVLDINSPVYVIGDIHGNLVDLVRILKLVGLPPQSRLLFLGDYVDRGEYSVEVVTLLFSLLVLYPNNVFLLRGNHEYSEVNRRYGLFDEIKNEFENTSIFDHINEVFSWLPIAAIVNKSIICVHGGMSEQIKTQNDLRQIRRPILESEFEPVADLVWSDPDSQSETPTRNIRGLGIQFGPKSLEIFLSRLGLDRMIRAHQCVGSGILKFGQQLYTVFSCSGYEGQDNRCGLILIDGQSKIECFSLPTVKQFHRGTAMMRLYSNEDIRSAKSAMDSIAQKLKEVEDEGMRKLEGRGRLLKKCRQSKSGETLIPLPLLTELQGVDQGEKMNTPDTLNGLPLLGDLKDRRVRRRTR
jgi:protein phosphatase